MEKIDKTCYDESNWDWQNRIVTIELGKTRVDYLKIEGYFGLFCQFCAWKERGKEENEKETGCKRITGNGYVNAP